MSRVLAPKLPLFFSSKFTLFLITPPLAVNDAPVSSLEEVMVIVVTPPVVLCDRVVAPAASSLKSPADRVLDPEANFVIVFVSEESIV